MRLAAVATAALLGVGCSGWFSGEGGKDASDKLAEESWSQRVVCDPVRAPMHQLTAKEYNRTVCDVLGLCTQMAQWSDGDSTQTFFDNDSDGQTSTSILVEQQLTAAEVLAAAVVADMARLVACDPAVSGDAGCGEAFIADFTRKMYRRPADPDELAALAQEFQWGLGEEGFAGGIRAVVASVAMSPHFLYRVEVKREAISSNPAWARLGDCEIASRLSYFIWNSAPDNELLDLCAAEQLRTPEQLEAQAQRMLADPRARRSADAFHTQWLILAGLPTLQKSDEEFNEQVSQSMYKGTLRRLEHIVFDSAQGNIEELILGNQAFVNQHTAPYYDLTTAPAGDEMQVAQVDAKRPGIITDAGLMAALAHETSTSPTFRGLLLREHLLCTPVPPPPPDLPEAGVIPDPDPSLTTRELFDQHRNDPACASCHKLMDPLGYPLENFNPVGKYATTDNGKPIDSNGELLGSLDADGPVTNARELAERLNQSSMVKQCVSKQWVHYALARETGESDQCTLDDLQQRFASKGFRLRDLLVEIVTSFAFAHRPIESEAIPTTSEGE